MQSVEMDAKLIAAEILPGESVYTDCPACGGRNKFSVTRTQEGVLWNCFRASCRARGSTITHGVLVPPGKPRKKPLRPYRGGYRPLSAQEEDYLLERFEIWNPKEHLSGWRLADDGRFLIPVLDPLGRIRGMMGRIPWDDDERLPACTFGGPKACLYQEVEGPTLSWHASARPSLLVLVEDQASALCLSDCGISAVALLGTQLDNDKVREIAMFRPEEVVIALDADATDQAFRLARKWGLAWRKTRVAILEKDIKDTPRDERKFAIGVL